MRCVSHLLLVLAVVLVGCRSPAPAAIQSTVSQQRTSTPTQPPVHLPVTSNPQTTVTSQDNLLAPQPIIPYAQVSIKSLLDTLEDLTAIQAYSGWRTAATEGERQAFAYLETRLSDLVFLNSLGISLEKQSFQIYLTTEIWEAGLTLEIAGREFDVPCNGLRGSRFDTFKAHNFDSDGALNDSDRDPLNASGETLFLADIEAVEQALQQGVKGLVIFLDYALIDQVTSPDLEEMYNLLPRLIEMQPAGLVLVTRFSNQPDESHGAFVGEGGILQNMEFTTRPPILYTRLEDLASVGIHSWEDLSRADFAHLTLDADVFSPADSGNLIARIPGVDSTQAIILGAHVDSPNSPGALDDGSGVAALLEVARVLDATRLQPAVDLYLAFFGSHEPGIYGSALFVATHQELLDQTIAMLELDCLSYPMDGESAPISLNTWSYGQYGDGRLVWPEYLAELSAAQGITVKAENDYGMVSDNGNFLSFNVPNADLSFINFSLMHTRGSAYLHHAGHLHDPYDEVSLVRELGDIYRDMVKIYLAAALQTGWEQPELRVPTENGKRALFIANHTSAMNVPTVMLLELGMALSWKGFDVDLVPHGERFNAQELAEASLVVLLPTMDYLSQPDEQWSVEEITDLEAYVRGGGLLVVVNSVHELVWNRTTTMSNEDCRDLNALLEPMGVRFRVGAMDAAIVQAMDEHPLFVEASYLTMFDNNGVPFSLQSGQVLARASGQPIIALLDYGGEGGQVLIVADIGLMMEFGQDGKNLIFLQNLARYALDRQSD